MPFRLKLGQDEQHYEFAHHALPEVFFKTWPIGLFRILIDDDGQDYLEHCWRMARKYMSGERDRGDVPRLTIAKRVGHTAFVMIKMPEPRYLAEAWMIAMIGSTEADYARYFTLEAGFTLRDQEDLRKLAEGIHAGHPDPNPEHFSDPVECTFLCEWLSDRTRNNLGIGPRPDEDSFLAAIARRAFE